LWRNGKFGILIVDDEPSVLMTYKLILEKRGYAVKTVETSTEAVRMLAEHKFDLLLCDYSLEQEHTGFEVIDTARKGDPGIPAVLLTGYASKETVDHANENNITVLFKPIDIHEFFRTIENLKRGKDGQEGDHPRAEDKQDTDKKATQTAEGHGSAAAGHSGEN
jgi:DNA-binding NtrC family response regulator